MKTREFWKQVEQRSVENKQIVDGGMPQMWAPTMALLGLHFWKMGLGLSLVITGWLWLTKYQGLMSIVRVIIWR